MTQSMIFRLVILNGEHRGERITVTPDPMRIGRDAACDIRFEDAEIASLHAEITHTPDGLHIRDLGSMNRILVNNHETREAQLKHGDVVEVGRTRFLIQAYVQAEVLGEAQEAKRRLWKKVVGVVIALMILATITQRCRREITPPPAHSRTKPATTRMAPPVVTSKTPALTPAATTSTPASSVNIAPPIEVEPGTEPLPLPAINPEPSTLNPVISTAPITNLPSAPLADSGTPSPSTLATSPSRFAAQGSSSSDLVSAEAAIATSRIDSAAAEMERAKKEIESAANEILQSRVREMMSDARSAASNQSPDEAEQVLAGIQRVDPDFAESYVERARLLAERGRLEPAMTQLSTLVRRAPDSPAAEKARAELTRLSNAREHYVFPFSGRIKIASTEINKFPESAGQSELRILSTTLEATSQEKMIDAAAVTITVRFYDRDMATGLIRPTTATITPPPPLQGVWPEKTSKTVSASYGVPAGLQRKDQFYGCLVRVHYYGALQDEWMQPKDLPADVQMAPREPRSR